MAIPDLKVKLIPVVLIAGVMFLGILITSVIVFHNNIYTSMINPREPYQTYTPPMKPDYSQMQSWASWQTNSFRAYDLSELEVDVFFIHPTTDYSGREWNAPIDEETASNRLIREVLPNFAAAFSNAGRVYAPKYRQATLFASATTREDARLAFQTAYQDILSAFDYYDTHFNKGRKLILAGMGQGAMMAARLLQDRFNNSARAQQLVAAYLMETALPLEFFEQNAATLKPCQSANDRACIIAWGGMIDNDKRAAERFLTRPMNWTRSGQLTPVEGKKLLCTNPLLWTLTEDFAPARNHRGGARAVGLEPGTDPAILPGAVSAQCLNGVLFISRPNERSLRPPIRLGANMQTKQFNLFYADIAINSTLRAKLALATSENNDANLESEY